MAANAQVLEELEALGTEQNRKVYRRHGVGVGLYGVSYANLGKLVRKIKVDHALAQHLWATGNHDARVLATMIADPGQADDALLAGWVGDLSNYVLTDAVTAYAARTPHVREKMERWTQSPDEGVASVGWSLLGCLAMRDAALPDEYFASYLATIERDIRGRLHAHSRGPPALSISG